MRFTLKQLFVAVGFLGLAFALIQSEGCGSAFTKIHSLAFSPDGKQLAIAKLNWRDANVSLKAYAANITRTISLLDVATVTPVRVVEQEFRPGNHGTGIQFLRQGRDSLAFTANAETLLFPEFGGGRILEYKLRFQSIATFLEPDEPREVYNFVLSQDRTILAANIWNGGVSLFGADDATTIVADPGLFVFNAFRPGIGLSSDNRWLAIRDYDKLKLYDAGDNLRAKTSFACSGGFAFGPGPDQLALSDLSNSLTRLSICDLATGQVQTRGIKPDIHEMKFTSDGRLVAATEDHVIVFNLETGEELKLEQPDWVTALATSPDGQTIAIGDNAGNVTLWDLATGKSSTLQAPGKSGHPWTLPAAVGVIVAAICLRLRMRPNNADTRQRQRSSAWRVANSNSVDRLTSIP